MDKFKTLSLLIDIFLKEGYSINDKDVIFCDNVSMIDAVIKCNEIKRISNILIYSCYVPNKKIIKKNENINIFDKDDIKNLAIKYYNLELFNMFN